MFEFRSFTTVCKKCEATKRESHTHIHVNWEKRNVVFICLDPECGNMEAFDKNFEPILINNKEKNNNKN